MFVAQNGVGVCVCVVHLPSMGGLGTGRGGSAAVPSPGRALQATPVPTTGATPGPWDLEGFCCRIRAASFRPSSSPSSEA